MSNYENPPNESYTVTTVDTTELGKAGFAVLLTMGILTLALGAAIMFWPEATVRVVAFLFGVWLILSGVAQIAQGFSGLYQGAAKAMLILAGLISIGLGVFCFTSVVARITVLVIFIMLGWLLRGVAYLATGIQSKGAPGRGALIGFGLVLLVLAGLIVFWPQATLTVLIYVVGIGLVLTGLFEIAAGFAVKKAGGPMTVVTSP